MAPALVQTINGITYPREVPMPEGMPEGWKAVEQAYGPNSKSAGSTYVRYSSLDGRHKQIMGPKQVVQLHCEDLGLPFETEFSKYEAAFKARKELEGGARAKEKEARGQHEGAKREEMIALSRERFGELKGPLVLAFPGWKCRWDWLPESQQTPKAFIAPDGREWKLLKDLECMFGTRITQGGEEAERIAKMVEAGRSNEAAQLLFSEGSRRCRESEGSVEIDPAREEVHVETLEQLAQKREARAKKQRTSKHHGNALHDVSSKVYPDQSGWAAFGSPEELRAGSLKFRALLRALGGFAEDAELVAVHGVAEETSRFAARMSGVFYRIGAPVNGRPCYQKLLCAPAVPAGLCCDGIYIMYSSSESQWQISASPLEHVPCIAYCKSGQGLLGDVSGPWQVQQQGTSDFAECALQIMVQKELLLSDR